MRTVVAALAIIGSIGTTAESTGAAARDVRPTAVHDISRGDRHLTAGQRRWFSRAVDHILRGAR